MTITAAWLAICAAALPLLTHLEIGASQAAARDGRTVAALHAASSAVRLQPWAASPYLQLALVAEQAGRLAVADAAIRRAIAGSDDWQLWLVAARVQTKQGHVGCGAPEPSSGAQPESSLAPVRRSTSVGEECALRSRPLSFPRGRDLGANHPSVVESSATEIWPEQLTESRVWWRDSLRRRMLLAADAATVTVFSLSIGFLVDGHIASAFWAEALLPLWVVLAKVQGLYDRDHRTLRHLTADEVPSILLWVVTGTATTMLFVPALSGEAPLPGQMVGPFLIAFATAVCFRCVARFMWRRTVPPDRTLIIGEGAPATAAQRKLELFRDIHAQPVATLSLRSGSEIALRRSEFGRCASIASSSLLRCSRTT